MEPEEVRYDDYQTCPVCNGEGVTFEPMPRPDDPEFGREFKCDDCNGTGVVLR